MTVALTITPAAIERLTHLLSKKEGVLGIRIGVKERGCSGFSYDIGYAEDKQKGDLLIEENGVKVFISNDAQLYIIGSELDYVQEDLFAGFKFNNPNAKGECGCGESFTV